VPATPRSFTTADSQKRASCRRAVRILRPLSHATLAQTMNVSCSLFIACRSAAFARAQSGPGGYSVSYVGVSEHARAVRDIARHSSHITHHTLHITHYASHVTHRTLRMLHRSMTLSPSAAQCSAPAAALQQQQSSLHTSELLTTSRWLRLREGTFLPPPPLRAVPTLIFTLCVSLNLLSSCQLKPPPPPP
jgi:hypothetical protein